jgi:GH24 family phage-related lysozyme (muramidase)
MTTVEQLSSCLIGILEGTRFKAYQDSGGVWTIGIGHTQRVTPGMTCTPDQVAEWFAEDSAPLFKLVEGLPVLKAAALVSFGFNCGIGSLGKVLAGTDTIGNPKYTHDMKGNTLSYLVQRRRLEQMLIELSSPASVDQVRSV